MLTALNDSGATVLPTRRLSATDLMVQTKTMCRKLVKNGDITCMSYFYTHKIAFRTGRVTSRTWAASCRAACPSVSSLLQPPSSVHRSAAPDSLNISPSSGSCCPPRLTPYEGQNTCTYFQVHDCIVVLS